MPLHIRPSSRTGATLVEVLVALGIGIMIVAVIILAHHALTQLAGRQINRQLTLERADLTINELRFDLHQLFLSADDDATAVTLENSATNLTSISFCRWAPRVGEYLLPTNRLERVTYRFDNADGNMELIRVTEALVGPDAEKPAATNRLGKTWPRMFVHLHDGAMWQTNWPFADTEETKRNPPRPRAARIQLLDASAAPVHETMVVIPSGLSVTSTIVRITR